MMNEADTCRTYILPKIKASGWEDDCFTEQMVLTPGRIVLSSRAAAPVRACPEPVEGLDRSLWESGDAKT
jgi:hypothetical protein